ncbi:MAG: hypothetical protein P4L85_11385 [Paludisphaera borealis]|uniref:hypothetical protein n=1 Tax=Paludisphaera borealis TaxID=1387353 RepID=UPI00284F4BBF|nr:hypothetical protein [Paludisphaera borealis]MDR3619943.1 hypothetical protein [Paludisphaera borealis]
MDAGMAGGIAGSVIGCMGGLIGTYFGIASTSRPHERALAIRFSVACWIWMAAVIGMVCFAPRPWGQLVVPLGPGITLAIPWCNRKLALARAEDEASTGDA